MSKYRNRSFADRMFSEHNQVSSAMAARYETCPVTKECTRCFPHGFETRSPRWKDTKVGLEAGDYRLREKAKARYMNQRRRSRQVREWERWASSMNSEIESEI